MLATLQTPTYTHLFAVATLDGRDGHYLWVSFSEEETLAGKVNPALHMYLTNREARIWTLEGWHLNPGSSPDSEPSTLTVSDTCKLAVPKAINKQTCLSVEGLQDTWKEPMVPVSLDLGMNLPAPKLHVSSRGLTVSEDTAQHLCYPQQHRIL